jgi:hypothetical protein
MRKNNNYSQQFNDEVQNTEDWEYEDDWEEEESIHARKDHQNHRGHKKGQARRSIEMFKEQQQLKELLGDDFDY